MPWTRTACSWERPTAFATTTASVTGGLRSFHGDASAELPTCSYQSRGRLFIGTHGEGRVLVLPVVKEGVLESTPRPIKNAGAYRIYWETSTPPGTAVRLQERCAATRETLVGAAFVGPDGTDQTFFEDPGASFHVAQTGFLQYRVVMTTKDPARSPYLKRVVVSQEE